MQREAKASASPRPNVGGAAKVFGAPPPQAHVINKEAKVFGVMPSPAKSPSSTPVKKVEASPNGKIQNNSQNSTPTKFISKRTQKAQHIEPEQTIPDIAEENSEKITENTGKKQKVFIESPIKEEKKIPKKSGIPVKKSPNNKSTETEKKSHKTSKIPTPKGKKRPLTSELKNQIEERPAIEQIDLGVPEEPEIDDNSDVYETDSDDELYQAQFFRAGTPRPEKIPTESKKLMEHIDEDDFLVPSSTQKKAVVILRDEDEDTEVEEQYLTPASTIKKSQPSTPKLMTKGEVPLYDEDAADDLFDGLIPNSKSSKGFSKLPIWQKSMLTSLLPLESQQRQRWILKTLEYLESLGFTSNKEGNYMEDIAKYVQNILDQHRIAGIGGLHQRIRVIIEGPRKSGKSAILSLLGKKVVIELAASELWKRTFVFAFDFNEHANAKNDQVRLYECIVHSTFTGLAAQMPLIARHAQSLAKTFIAAAGGHPLLPRSFTLDNDFKLIVPRFQDLINLISESFADRSETDSFLANTVQFPHIIAQYLGFDHVFLVCDHIDSFGVGETVTEHVKQLLDLHSFAISGKDSGLLEEKMKPLDIDSIDLTHSTFRSSSLDVVKSVQNTDKEFLLSFEGGGAKLPLGAEVFGGCAAFLAKWDELNAIADEADRLMEGDEDEQDVAAEKLLLLQSRIQAILPDFISGDVKPIINVSRVTRK